MIKNSLLYGSETWRLTENNKRRVEATEMDALRRSSRISRKERIRGRPRKTWMECVRGAMKTRHLEAHQWLNRKEWCLGSGRQRQLSQDRKERWLERIRNVTIRQQIGLEETIVKEIEQNQLTWCGHVQRMVEGRLPKIALKSMPKQKGARGRPKKNWMESIRKATKERNLNEGQWEDRKQWSIGVGQVEKRFETDIYIYMYIYIYIYIYMSHPHVTDSTA